MSDVNNPTLNSYEAQDIKNQIHNGQITGFEAWNMKNHLHNNGYDVSGVEVKW